MRKLKKSKGNLIIQATCIAMFCIMYIACIYVFTKYKISAESEIVSDCLLSSDLAAFSTKNLDLNLLSEDPGKKIIIIKDPNMAFETFLRHLKFNFSLDNNYVPINSVSFIKSQINIEKFIIYNVNGNDITVYDYDTTTGNFVSSFHPGSKGIMTTPKGSIIEATTVHSQINFTINNLFGYTNVVHPSEDADVLKR